MTKLADNAFRELREGEQYEPVLPPASRPREITPWSVLWGVLMAVVFSAASAYLGLKVGQVFEAAIPISIIAVGLAAATKRKGAIGENVIIQCIGETSGAIVAGAIFTLPAIYILSAKYPGMGASFWQIFTASLLGGAMGLVFLIPFRRYFVKEQHGRYPFPEATATTQVLVNGAEGGGAAKKLAVAGLIGGVYDFAVATFGLWSEQFTSRALWLGETLADKAKLVFKINTSAAVVGLGYIIGLRYSLIIFLGSAAVWWVIVPLMSLVWGDTVLNQWDAGITESVGQMSPEMIFTHYGKSIGIGAIAMAGVVGIVRSWGVIRDAVGLASRELRGKGAAVTEIVRTDEDVSWRVLIIATVAIVAAIAAFLFFGVMGGDWLLTIVALLLVVVTAFLFTTVAANATAIVGTNPVSGMTLMTLILASVVMAAMGLSGTGGMVAALLMGSVSCTALSMAGCFVTDLKIGYWIGNTPRKQEQWKLVGTIVSAATVAAVMMLLNETYGFASGQLAAPQANAMAAVIEPLMNGGGAPWTLYAIGAVVALVLTWAKVPALAFALGMFIPLELNTPLVVGGAISWWVTSRSKDAARNRERGERGTLLASGFIAGGALMGVVSALLRFMGYDFTNGAWLANYGSELLSLLMYAMLCIYLVRATKKQ